MKIRLPSFRTQILLVVLFLVFNSVLFYRNYFLDSLQNFTAEVETLNTRDDFNRLYQKYAPELNEAQRKIFKEDMEKILAAEWQKGLAREMFQKEVALYSKFIFVFLTLAVLLLFFISFNLITRPLQRLQRTTQQLSRGNWNIQVPESPFSPLNDLIVSFNTMIRELEVSRNKIIQAEKEAAWRDMARIMAHEIKNPLTPIRLSLERLQHKFTSGAKDLKTVFDHVTTVIQEEVNNLQKLASEFSQFAKLPPAVPAHYDLNAQVQELTAPYQSQADFTLHLDPNLPTFFGDKDQLKQVITNLIQNSIQSAENPCHIQLTTRVDRGGITILFQDNGKGIPAEDLAKIFDPYFTRRTKGTGLGLSIVKRVVESHDGTINVASDVGTGTRFTLHFPTKDKR